MASTIDVSTKSDHDDPVVPTDKDLQTDPQNDDSKALEIETQVEFDPQTEQNKEDTKDTTKVDKDDEPETVTEASTSTDTNTNTGTISMPAPTETTTKATETATEHKDTNPDTNPATNQAAETPEPTEQPIAVPPISKKKKRLTLQERLALATKSKEKKEMSPRTSMDEKDDISDDSKSPQIATPKAVSPILPASETLPHITTTQPEVIKPEAVDKEVQRLIKENQQLKAEIGKLGKTKAQTELQKKDDIIKQLMTEGEQLSIKELKLNDTIKKLKTTTFDYEQVIEEMSHKNEENIGKLTELDEVLKNHKVKSVSELGSILSTYNHMKSQDLQSKLKEATKNYEDEVKKIQLKNRELNELKIQFDLVKESHSIELANKDDVIRTLRAEVSSINSSNSKEIIRLENKIESLIMENEQKQSFSNGGSSNDTETKDFAKVLKNYNNLQTEMLNSKSNWDLIEINFNSKINDLTTKLDGLKKEKLQLIGELKIIRNRLIDSEANEAEMDEKLQLLNGNLTQKDSVIDDLNLEVVNLNEKLVKLNQIYNNEKQSLTTQVKQLQEKTKRTSIPPIQPVQPVQEQYLEDLSFPSPNPNGFEDFRSSTSQFETSMDNSFYNNSRNISSHSLNSTEIDNTASSIPFNSFQLINKLSSTVKTLKVELNSLKDENEQLNLDKDKLERSMLQNSKKIQEFENLHKRIADLEAELQKKVENEDSLLVIIGEKEERVGELVDDVQNWKELYKSQVEQMIQEK